MNNLTGTLLSQGWQTTLSQWMFIINIQTLEWAFHLQLPSKHDWSQVFLLLFSSVEEKRLCVTQPPQGHHQERIWIRQLELSPRLNPSNTGPTLTWWQPQGWQHWREGGNNYKTDGRTEGMKLGSGESPYLDVWGFCLWEDVALISECMDLTVFWRSKVLQEKHSQCKMLLTVSSFTWQQLCKDLWLAASYLMTELVHFYGFFVFGWLVCLSSCSMKPPNELLNQQSFGCWPKLEKDDQSLFLKTFTKMFYWLTFVTGHDDVAFFFLTLWH